MENKMIREAIIALRNRENLSYDMAKSVMDEIMSGNTSQIQMSAYLTALAMKGETIDEITGSAKGMREHCIRLLHDMDVLEIVGTGGDHSDSFNISTTAAFVISAGGVPVAKHGNRAASSKCGAADVLEALGVNITIPPELSTELLNKINICFLFADKAATQNSCSLVKTAALSRSGAIKIIQQRYFRFIVFQEADVGGNFVLTGAQLYG